MDYGLGAWSARIFGDGRQLNAVLVTEIGDRVHGARDVASSEIFSLQERA
jgi:hypothetical protein